MPYKNRWKTRRLSHQDRARRVALKKAIMREAKNKPCADCGVQYPFYVMQFDHRDRTSKRAPVSKLAGHNGSLDGLVEEIAKCDVVCANCHAARTWFGKHFIPRASLEENSPKPQLQLFVTKS